MEERKGLGEKEREPQPPATQHTSPRALCFREGRQHFGERSASIIGQALRNGVLPEDVLFEIRDVVEWEGDVDELAHALWCHWGRG